METQQIIPPFAFQRFEKIEPVKKKDKIREEIENQTKEFIARGGKINEDNYSAVKNPRTIKQACAETTNSLQSYIDSIPSIKIKYCPVKIKHSIYIDGVFIESHDSRHKANKIAKKIYEAKNEN